MVHGRLLEAVVIADDQDYRPLRSVKLFCSPFEDRIANPAVVEEIAGDEQRIHVELDAQIDSGREGPLARPAIRLVEMAVRCVKERCRPGWSHRSSIGRCGCQHPNPGTRSAALGSWPAGRATT